MGIAVHPFTSAVRRTCPIICLHVVSPDHLQHVRRELPNYSTTATYATHHHYVRCRECHLRVYQLIVLIGRSECIPRIVQHREIKRQYARTEPKQEAYPAGRLSASQRPDAKPPAAKGQLHRGGQGMRRRSRGPLPCSNHLSRATSSR